jgi:hypothetical protein
MHFAKPIDRTGKFCMKYSKGAIPEIKDPPIPWLFNLKMDNKISVIVPNLTNTTSYTNLIWKIISIF